MTHYDTTSTLLYVGSVCVWRASGAEREREAAPDTDDADEGQRRWNRAVLKGGKALFVARAEVRKKLEARREETAKAEMRPAR
jgi:hypothetical protein